MKLSRFMVLGLALSFWGCGPTQNSHTQEQIDAANNLLKRYGLAEMPLYSELIAKLKFATHTEAGDELIPWTDSYWPTTEKGMAHRWGPVLDKEDLNTNAEGDFAFGAYYRTALKASDQSGWLSLNLSPAEKFDLTYQTLFAIDSKKADTLMSALETIDGDLKALLNDHQRSDKERIAAKRALATRYLDQLNTQFGTLGTMDRYFPMTTEGLRNWLSKAESSMYQFPGEYSEDAQSWSWEGLCHGWAPAAVMAAEPKHAVRVSLGQNTEGKKKDLLFSEGDIRGLLTKAWAEAANPDMFFVGRRCDANVDDVGLDIRKNGSGRGIGGTFYRWKDNQSTEVPFTLVQEYPRSTGENSLMRIVLEDQWKDNVPSFAYIIQILNTGTYFFVQDEQKAFAAIEHHSEEGLEAIQSLNFLGCWDVNPASFHTVLMQNIGKDNRGLIMDRTRSGQVWNQPIYKVEFEVGALQDVSNPASADVAKAYRAPGTVSVASVTATVYWSSEPYRARFSYHDPEVGDMDRDHIESSVYQYTLEFDKDQRLIGGEWGTLASFDTPESPDFIFGFRRPAEPMIPRYGETAYLRKGYDRIVKKIHQCSLQEKTDGEVTLTIPSPWGQPQVKNFAYVDCKL